VTGQSTQPLEILSVARNFGTGRVLFAGHEESYQLGLSRAAAAAGLSWTILVPQDSALSDPQAVPCLDRTDAQHLVSSLDAHLRARPRRSDHRLGVVIYEADTELAAAIARTAPEHPSIRFLVNLFRAEPGLDAPLVRRKGFGAGPKAGSLAPSALASQFGVFARIDWPSNVLLTAESDAKALMARSAGLPVTSVWHLHSEMAAEDLAGQIDPGRPEDGQLRVLIALRSSQLYPPLVREVMDVIEGVRRIDPDGRVTWVMSGRFDQDGRVVAALRRLERAGVQVSRHEHPLSRRAYAQGLLEVDAAWMPAVWPYRIQSSGKALDALVLGRPIIAPAGTAGAHAIARWVPGAPTYGTTIEAVHLFLRLPTLIETLQGALRGSIEKIRQHYSPTATVSWVLAQLSGSESSAPPLGPISIHPGETDKGGIQRLGDESRRPRVVYRWARRRLGRAVYAVRPVGRMIKAVPRGLVDLWHFLLERR